MLSKQMWWEAEHFMHGEDVPLQRSKVKRKVANSRTVGDKSAFLCLSSPHVSNCVSYHVQAATQTNQKKKDVCVWECWEDGLHMCATAVTAQNTTQTLASHIGRVYSQLCNSCLFFFFPQEIFNLNAILFYFLNYIAQKEIYTVYVQLHYHFSIPTKMNGDIQFN